MAPKRRAAAAAAAQQPAADGGESHNDSKSKPAAKRQRKAAGGGGGGKAGGGAAAAAPAPAQDAGGSAAAVAAAPAPAQDAGGSAAAAAAAPAPAQDAGGSAAAAAAAPAPAQDAGGSAAAAAAAPAPAQDAGGSAAAAAAAPAPAQDAGQREQQLYLMKSEPDVFSIDDLAARPDQTEPWDGVRSHQAKKVLQSMRRGDQAFFYHSNAKPPGIVGIVEIVREAYPDHSQFDSSSKYYDASAKEEAPKWFMVDCRLVRRLARQIPLEELKQHGSSGGPLADMALFKYGRLSVQPVTRQQWEYVLSLEQQQPGGKSSS